MVAIADSIYGPYDNRFCGIRFGDNNAYFQEPNNEWYTTAWCYPDKQSFLAKSFLLEAKI